MTYHVITAFYDIKANRDYKVGDVYEGEVYDALLNSNNQYHTPFIKKATNTEIVKRKQDYSGLTVEELKAKAKSRGIDGYNGMKKADLLQALSE